ncbi:unnamed protein product [Absidia cylindrospora]
MWVRYIKTRPHWPEDIYLRLLNSHTMATYPLPEQCVWSTSIASLTPHQMYNTKQDINHSESVFVYPFLRAVAAGTNQDLCDFGPGERLTVVLTILKPICHITGICRQAIWVI